MAVPSLPDRPGSAAPDSAAGIRRSLRTLAEADVALDKDRFLRSLLRVLTGTLQDVVGVDEASGFVSVVGQSLGEQIDRAYHERLGDEPFDRDRVAAVLVDLKRRIDGDFFVIEATEERIVLGNRRCPFGHKVLGRPSLCMMTSNVFGTISAENLGFAKVELQETIAEGAQGCRVLVHLRKTPAVDELAGREYYRVGPGAAESE